VVAAGVPGSLSAIRSVILGGSGLTPHSWKEQLMVTDFVRDKVTYIYDGRSGARNGDIKMCSF